MSISEASGSRTKKGAFSRRREPAQAGPRPTLFRRDWPTTIHRTPEFWRTGISRRRSKDGGVVLERLWRLHRAASESAKAPCCRLSLQGSWDAN